MRFTGLQVRGWRQFSQLSISFHPSLTVITGANGAGKSTILRLLAQHFGFNHSVLATPTMSKSGSLNYLSGLLAFRRSDLLDSSQHEVGQVSYEGGASAPLLVPSGGAISYNVQIPAMQSVPGLFIGSHRPTSGYQQVSSIPTNAITSQQAYQAYNQEVQAKYNNSYTQYSPIYRIKEAIISMATFGPGNANVQRNPVLDKNFGEFKEILKRIMPLSIGFRDISVRIPDVVLVTESGDFVVDAASGGLMALIDLAWQLFLFSRDNREFVAVIDEPENHLHPSMQRTVMGSLLDAFPNAQFIVATHSPFVVTSVKNSSVFVLKYEGGDPQGGPGNYVHSVELDRLNKAGTASEVLRGVLGVPVTLPLWAESEIARITSGFSVETLDRSKIGELRSRLEGAGLGDFYPEALNQITARL